MASSEKTPVGSKWKLKLKPKPKHKKEKTVCLTKIQLYHIINAAKGGKRKGKREKICPHARDFVEQVIKEVEKET